MKIQLPDEVSGIIAKLKEHGYEAYAVGGCVRDSVMGVTPNDWDITTSAKPDEIKKVFRNTIDTGIMHGTVTVRKNKKSFEVTTYRIDGDYSDARHPDSVSFTGNLKDDLARRDFTINAMAYNDEDGIIDVFGGLEDIKKGSIRCVGRATERFSEDALRMLRAVRFSAQLGFSIECETKEAIEKLYQNIEYCSMERICQEMIKLICSDCPQVLRDLYELKLSSVFFPEWDDMMKTEQNTKHHIWNVGEHTIRVMSNVHREKSIRLAALLHDVAKPVCKKTDDSGADHFTGHPQVGASMALDIMKRWKLDNATMDRVSKLVMFHDERVNPTFKGVRKCLSKMGEEICPDLLELRRADVMGQSDYLRGEKLRIIDEFERVYLKVLEDDECFKISDLKIGGKDIMEIGVKKGPCIGEILKYLLEWVIDEPERNQKDELINKAREWIESKKNL